MRDLDYLIERESLFEDSALEDAVAYAHKITTGADRFKKEKQNGRVKRTAVKDQSNERGVTRALG